MYKRPSQKVIARAAGVSQTVVSHVLNNKASDYGVSEATQQRVREALQSFDYAPNIAARALQSGRNNLLGVHTFEALFPTNQDSYYFELMVGLEGKAVELGQDLVLLTSAHQPDGDRGLYPGGHNRLRITDGAVMLGFDQKDDELERLAAEGFPFVFVGRRHHTSTLMPYVTADYATAARELLQLVADQKHSHIAYLASPRRREPQEERLTAVRTTCQQLGLAVEEQFVTPEEVTSALVGDLRAKGVTAVIAEGSSLLTALSRVCAENDIAIPDDLSVASLDAPAKNIGLDRLDWTHLSVPLGALGGHALALLIDLIEGRVGIDHHVALPCPVHPGATMQPPKQLGG